MKIKKFNARNFSEALFMVRREMGDDALILASEERKEEGSCVEVTAAVDYDLPGAGRSGPGAPTDGLTKAAGPAADQAGVDKIKKDLEDLRATIEEMKSMGYELTLPEGKRRMVAFLRERSIKEELAVELSGKAASLNELAALMSDGMETFAHAKKVVMMVGPTGVGKTTTIAKLSAIAARKGKKVAMINLDTYRIGAIEQIRIYARIIGVPLDIASDLQDLRASLRKYKNKDLIFIDTTGRNPKDSGYIEELLPVYGLGFPVATHLLMSANSSDDFLTEAHSQYGRLPIDCISFTKLDEAVRCGVIYNMTSLYRKPVGYITTGQRVPQDIEFPNSSRLAGMILKCEAA